MGGASPLNEHKVIPHIYAQKPIFQVIVVKLILPEPSPLHVQGSPAIDIDSPACEFGSQGTQDILLFLEGEASSLQHKECSVPGKKVM